VNIEFDHLVVAAATLDDGARWCAETLGVAPDAGGVHPLMGTHNRLLSIASPAFPRCYLELIAIDPAAAPPARRRWFALDDAALQAALRRDGPRLVHWVARSPAVEAARAALRAAGAPDPGVPVAASRGPYRWRITLRDDGQPQCGGALPALIEWAPGAHPSDALVHRGVALRALALSGLGTALRAALGAVAPTDAPGTAALAAELTTPLGIVTLRSSG
jgi:hypothetical protein